VEQNAETYLLQVFKILDKNKTEVRYNNEWLGKLTSTEVVQLCAHYRLARMLEREDFRSRLDSNLPISVHELLYPLLTAYDAVALKSDVELGATEQKFNLLVHREIQREYGLPAQVVMTMPILVGLDGERKMSKSFGNYIGITEEPAQMFGKLMSISDTLMWSYYELLTDFGTPVIVRLQEEVKMGVLHPMDAKLQMAHTIVAGFHGEDAAREAADEFRLVYRDRKAPTDMPELKLAWGKRPLYSILTESGLASSRSEAERLIKQGAVEVGGEIEKDVKRAVVLNPGDLLPLRVGKKKFLRIVGV
jgi:tyrosyl-tRNA synthetase